MEKLLHERLRETTDLCCTGEMIAHVIGIGPLRCKGLTCNECVKILMSKLGDEIEKYYIPRPRFEDGEPVQFGDATAEIEKVEAILYEATGTFELHMKKGSGCGTTVCIYEKNELVKRRIPKVFDADGVEIKVGDTVWNLDNIKRSATVSKIYHGEYSGATCVRCVDEDGKVLWDKYPCKLTHREPDSLKNVESDSQLPSYAY